MTRIEYFKIFCCICHPLERNEGEVKDLKKKKYYESFFPYQHLPSLLYLSEYFVLTKVLFRKLIPPGNFFIISIFLEDYSCSDTKIIQKWILKIYSNCQKISCFHKHSSAVIWQIYQTDHIVVIRLKVNLHEECVLKTDWEERVRSDWSK